MSSRTDINLTDNRPVLSLLCKSDIFVLSGLIFLVIILFFIRINSLPLIDPDEPRYATSAREMIESGNWVVPYFNGHPRLVKPPFFYWLVAMSFKLFGVSELSARLPSLVFALGGVVITYLWARTMWGIWSAFWTGFILAICPLYISIARLCITDMTMSFFLYLSLFLFYIGYKRGVQGLWSKIGLYISLAIMCLTKGHVGILIFLLVTCTFLIAMKDIGYMKKLWHLPGFLVFVGIILPWGIRFLLDVGIKDVAAILSTETIGRFIKGYHHPEPIYYYIKVFFLGFFPWSIFIPMILWLGFKWMREKGNGSGDGDCGLHVAKGMAPNSGTGIVFFGVWLIVVAAFFSMSRSKLFTYILPMAPTVPFLVVFIWNRLRLERCKSKYFSIVLSLLLFIFVFSLTLVFFVPKWLPARYGMHFREIVFIAMAFCACMAFNVLIFIFKGIDWLRCGLGFTSYLILAIIAVRSDAFIGNSYSVKEMVMDILPAKRDSYTLLSYRKPPPSLVFYSGGYVKEFDDDLNSLQLSEDNRDVYIYMRKKDYERDGKGLNNLNLHLVRDGYNWVILWRCKDKT